MTDKKISELPAASILTGAEIIPVVQAGSTVQTTLSFVNEAPLAASRYVNPGMTAAQQTVALQDWLNALANVPNSEGRFDERQYEINASLIVPGLRGLNLGGLGVIGQDSGVTNDGAGTIILPPANTPAFIFKSNMDTGSLTPYHQKFHDFAVRYAAVSGTTNTRQIPFLFEDTSEQLPTWFHNTFERITLQNVFRGWSLGGNAGQQPTVWDSHWRDCMIYGCQRNGWSFMPPMPVGQPINTFRDIGVFNTNTPVIADGPVFDFGVFEFTMNGVDIEGWRNQVLAMYGGYQGEINGLHLEHHVVDATTTNYFLFLVQDGMFKLRNSSLSGTSLGGADGVTIMANAGTSDAVVDLDGITMAWSSVVGTLALAGGAGGRYRIGPYRVSPGMVAPAVASNSQTLEKVWMMEGPGAWQTPTLINSWAVVDEPVRYRREGDTVRILGSLTGGGLNTIAFVLPAGFRPAVAGSLTRPVWSSGAAGSVVIEGGGNFYVTSAYAFFDLTFRAA